VLISVIIFALCVLLKRFFYKGTAQVEVDTWMNDSLTTRTFPLATNRFDRRSGPMISDMHVTVLRRYGTK
jgi:hypothetical protein